MMAAERRPVIFHRRRKYGVPSCQTRRPSIRPPAHIQLPAAEMKRPARDPKGAGRRQISDPLHLREPFELAVTAGAPGGPDT